jgi:hypothetical protein
MLSVSHPKFLICKGTTRKTRMRYVLTPLGISGGARSLANAFRKRKKVGGDGWPTPSTKLTPSLISVLGLRSLRARRRHDDRWGDLALNMDAAARSFRAVQFEEGDLLRWQREPYRSRPLPGSCSTSSLPLGFARGTKMPSLLPSSTEVVGLGETATPTALLEGNWLADGLLS